MDSIKLNNITIDLLPGPIGISHSGGADSAILLYILMKYLDGPINVFTCASKLKQRVAPHIALNVIDKCIDLTGKTDVYHHTFYVDDQDSKNLFDYQRQFVNLNLVNIIYTGKTALPPLDECSKFKNGILLLETRDPNKTRPVYTGRRLEFYMPFHNHNKKDIYELYKTLGVLDDLFPITRSCESLSLKYGHCGKCWWCEERQWAFGRLE
jgi:hypothetical protein